MQFIYNSVKSTHAVEHCRFHWIIDKLHPLCWWLAPFSKTICQCNYPTRTKEIFSNATSVGNKWKQTEDRKTFVISNILSIVSSPSKKAYHNEVNAIKNLLQCSRSSAYRQRRTASTKRGHLIAQFKNTAVKWSIEPCIVRTKKVSKALRQEIVDGIMKNTNVRQYPITCDT